MCQMTNEVRQKKLVSTLNLKSAEKQVIVNGVLNCFVFIASKLYDIYYMYDYTSQEYEIKITGI